MTVILLTVPDCCTIRAKFTKQGKLALECNFINAQMGRKKSTGDLLTMRTLKNRHSKIISIMASAIYQEQCEILPALDMLWMNEWMNDVSRSVRGMERRRRGDTSNVLSLIQQTIKNPTEEHRKTVKSTCLLIFYILLFVFLFAEMSHFQCLSTRQSNCVRLWPLCLTEIVYSLKPMFSAVLLECVYVC